MNPIKLPATIQSVEQYGDDTFLLRIQPERKVPRYKPGQFLHLTIDPYDPAGGFWPESRVFSIASAYGDPLVEIVYSVKGAYTTRMKNELSPGTSVWLKLPYGDFVVDSRESGGQRLALVAGGTGISPFLPLLRVLDSGAELAGDVLLYYGVRQNRAALKRDLLGRLATQGKIRLQYCVQYEEPDFAQAHEARQGMLDIDSIHAENAVYPETEYYLSGPPVMIRSFKKRLGELGVAAEKIKIDEWE